ncbi:MAG TPA: S-methyl-5-thioribose-1-phosphate isomerase, partial [Planctomycetota bacterium]|nr:S-methyl-5-thioribose-1-phosphate isomerase [Planctomycetota bacterium]
EVADYLSSARPTAVNLQWACARLRRIAEKADTTRRTLPGVDTEAGAPAAFSLAVRLLEEARAIELEDREMCRRIGEHGARLVADGAGVLTHCTAGALATAGAGTALSPIYVAHAAGRRVRVYADETRPLLQGSRLTAWELSRAGVDVTLICDGMSGSLMRRGKVDLAIVGADRIARNGDVANKIGTYNVAVLAKQHGIPFYVAAPSSTFDLSIATGAEIPIEERGPEEVRGLHGRPTAPGGVKVWNPAFDVTPAELISAIVTEKGIIERPSEERVTAMIGSDPGRG